MYHFIVNIKARSGHGKQVWAIVEEELNKKNISYKQYITQYPSHAGNLAKELSDKLESGVIIAVGGDGTVNEVINGFQLKPNLSLGYIPAGSSNDLARSLAISPSPLKALETILNSNHTICHNIGLIQYDNSIRRFMVSCGIGFDAAICHEAMTSKIKKVFNKINLGKLTYVGIALKQLLFLKAQKGVIWLDQKQKMEFSKIIFISIHNHKYEGGGFMFCPDAKADDQLLDICIVENISKWRILSLLPTALHGHHIKQQGVHIFQCKQVDILMENLLPVHADGEPCSKQNTLHVTCNPENISFIIPDL